MSEYATKGAMLKCTLGAVPSPLQVTSNMLFSVQGNTVATTSDKAPMVNIMPFGACSAKNGNPCVPSPTVWSGFITSVNIPGGNPLLKTSTIMCAAGGGCIRFQNSGQMKPDKVETNPDSPQIDVLKRAAIDATPFVEECEKVEENVKKEIIRMFCIDDNGEQKTLDKLPIDQEFTLCIETQGMDEGEEIKVEMEDADGRTYKNGEKTIKLKGIVELDRMVYIDGVKIEF